MASESVNAGQSPTFDSRILQQLACPACFGDLRLTEDAIVCAACGRAYPLIDGIPVLICERAVIA